MAQYLIRKGFKGYEIAKFEDSDGPVAVYWTTSRSCSCPAYRSCKHLSILSKWVKNGEIPGAVLSDTGEVLNYLQV